MYLNKIRVAAIPSKYGIGMSIALQYPMGMNMGVDINFTNEYE